MRGLLVLLVGLVFSFGVHAQQCPVEIETPNWGYTGDSLDFSANLLSADWRITGPDGERLFQGTEIRVLFSLPGVYQGLVAGQNACEEVIRQEFQVLIVDPLGEVGVSINGGDDYTRDRNVVLSFTSTGATQYLVSNSPNCRGSEWRPIENSTSWELAFDNSEGRVFAKFRNAAEESPCVSDSITHDDVAPNVTMLSAPPLVDNNVEAAFRFEIADATSGPDTLLCSVQGAPNVPCSLNPIFNVNEGSQGIVFRARDRAGNISPVGMYMWRVDLTKPTVRLLAQPDAITNSTEARFRFIGEDESSEIVSYLCQLDQSITNCDTLADYEELREGAHQFLVIAEDAAGNRSDPAIYRWTVDTIPPLVRIVNSPPFWTTQTAGHIDLEVDESSSYSLSCELNGQDFSCGLKTDWGPLNDGEYEFLAKATDLAGNESVPVVTAWNVDSTAPFVELTQVPTNPSSELSPEFRFQAEDAGIGLREVRCQLDDQPVFTCESPLQFSGLSIGAHELRVWAIDDLQNASAPVIFRWEIDVAPPQLFFAQTPPALSTQPEAQFMFMATSSVGVAYYQCSVDQDQFSECMSPYAVVLSDGQHDFRVQAFDEFGQMSNVISYSWAIDSSGPVITITEAPESIIVESDSRVVFEVEDLGGDVASVTCRLDDEEPEACSSPVDLADLMEGPHSFQIFATDNLGNESRSEIVNFEVDLQLPTVSWVRVPEFETTLVEAEFVFEAQSKVGIERIECELDRAGFEACESPKVLRNLSLGNHEYHIRAFDIFGRVSGTLAFNWTIVKAPELIEEEFISEGGARSLDLLVVMDNSGSMKAERKYDNLLLNFTGLLDELRGIDWQLSLTTTDAQGPNEDEGGRRITFYNNASKVLTPESRKPEKDLIETILRTEGGSNTEEPIWVLQKFIGRAENQDFFREEAAFMGILITDEDEASKGDSRKRRNSPEYLMKLLRDKFGPDKLIQFHGVFWKPEDRRCKNAMHRARVHQRLISATSGLRHSICEPQYSKGLQGYTDIIEGKELLRQLQCQPLGGEVNVTMNPVPDYEIAVTVNGSQLQMMPAPPTGTLIQLNYTCAKYLRDLISRP